MPTKRVRDGKVTAWYKQPAVKVGLKIGGVIMKVLVTLLLILVIAGIVAGMSLFVYLNATFDPEEDLPNLNNIKADTTSMIYVQDDAGAWVEYTALTGARHEYVELNKIPIDLQHAVIAIEDERFEDHYGVDWKRTVAAVFNEVLHIRSRFGGSTLTQQLIKNLTGEKDQNISRKVNEIFAATYMESTYSKDTILEAYLNVMPLTRDIIGVGYGAKYYFGKEVSELTLAESAALATITNNPSIYDPYNHPENVRDRQHLVLRKMLEVGFISEGEYIQAMNEELVYQSGINYTDVMNFYTDMVVESVIDDLVAQGYSTSEASLLVFNGGLKIYSYEDPDLQERIEKLFADEDIYPAHIEGDEEDPRFAFFAVDYDGKVVTVVGDRGEKTGNRLHNIATMGIRQCGSSIKPVAVYAPAIELNMTYYSERILDEPTMTVNKKNWPPNYGGARYGYVTVNQALRQSLNTIPVKLLTEITPAYSHSYLTDMLGISTYVKEDINASALALGGATHGVHLSELVSAYEMFGNGGIYNGWRCYEKVLDADDNVLLTTAPANVQALSEDTAYVMNRLMTETIYETAAPAGTMRGIRGSWQNIKMFGKSGTTDDNNDVVNVGGTPYCVGGAWFGYRNNKEMTNTQAKCISGLFNLAMVEIHKGYEPAEFVKPTSVIEAQYCMETGLLANEGCTKRATGYYRSSNIPEMCAQHTPTATTTTTTDSTGTTTGSGTDTTTTGTGTEESTSSTGSTETTTTTQP